MACDIVLHVSHGAQGYVTLRVGVGKGITALPPLQTGRETFASSGFPEREMVL
jgi:hypothetical protein